MATHSSILAWRIPMDRGAWGATVYYRVTKSWTRLKQLSTHAQFTNYHLKLSPALHTHYSCLSLDPLISHLDHDSLPYLVTLPILV